MDFRRWRMSRVCWIRCAMVRVSWWMDPRGEYYATQALLLPILPGDLLPNLDRIRHDVANHLLRERDGFLYNRRQLVQDRLSGGSLVEFDRPGNFILGQSVGVDLD